MVAQWSIVIAALNANVGVLGPLTAERYLGGARAWSVIVAAQALGTIAGAGLAARVRVRRPILVAVLATFPAAVPIALLAVRAPVWLIAVAMFTAGISNDVFGVLWATTIHREIPEESLSRVSSYDGFGSLAFAPLGLLIAGPLAATVGLGHTLAGCASLIVLATLGALLAPGYGGCARRPDGGGRGGGQPAGPLGVGPDRERRRPGCPGRPSSDPSAEASCALRRHRREHARCGVARRREGLLDRLRDRVRVVGLDEDDRRAAEAAAGHTGAQGTRADRGVDDEVQLRAGDAQIVAEEMCPSVRTGPIARTSPASSRPMTWSTRWSSETTWRT